MSSLSISHGLVSSVISIPTVPPPLPSFALISARSGGVSGTTAHTGPNVTATITAPAIYAGTYTVAQTVLDQGPVALIDPSIIGDGSPAEGETLSATPALWLYETASAVPDLQIAWQVDTAGNENFADIPGTEAQSYDLTAADAGNQVRYVETATQAVLPAQIAASQPLTIETPALPGSPTLSGAPIISGDPIEAMDLVADTSDTWLYAGSAATVVARDYRLLINGSVTVGPQDTPTLSIPTATGGQSFALEMQVTIAEAGGVQSVWVEILSGTIQNALELTSTIDGEVTVNNVTGLIEVNIAAPPIYAGVYTVSGNDLATGPINLVPPRIINDGNLAVGGLVSAHNGLWLYDPDQSLPQRTFIWQSNGSDISGATGNSYTLSTTDEGSDITLLETLTQSGTGSRSVISDVLSIPGSSTALLTEPFTAYGSGDDITLSPNWQYEEQQGGSYFTADGVGNGTIGNVNNGAQATVYAGGISDDQYCEAVFDGISGTPSQANFGISARQAGTDRVQFIYIQSDGDLLLNASGPAGGASAQRFAHSLVSGDVLRLEVVGTTATAYLNGTQVMTLSLGAITTGKPGLRGFFQGTGGGRFSNFTCGDM